MVQNHVERKIDVVAIKRGITVGYSFIDQKL
jgi:hypothetical protein